MEKNIEIERKFIIKMPNIPQISSEKGYSDSKIVQIYLESDKGVTHRIRKRAFPSRTEYTETKKIRIDAMSAVEEEREIDGEEFLFLSKRIRSGSRPVIKSRHLFFYKDTKIEIDIYPDWERTAIMETELSSRNDEIALPPYIEIISEVTGDARYSNSAMSHSFPEESI